MKSRRAGERIVCAKGQREMGTGCGCGEHADGSGTSMHACMPRHRELASGRVDETVTGRTVDSAVYC